MQKGQTEFRGTEPLHIQHTPKPSRTQYFSLPQIGLVVWSLSQLLNFFFAARKTSVSHRAADNLHLNTYRKPNRNWLFHDLIRRRMRNKFFLLKMENGMWKMYCGCRCLVFHFSFSVLRFPFYLRLPLLAAFRVTLKSSFSRLTNSCKARKKISLSRMEITAV